MELTTGKIQKREQTRKARSERNSNFECLRIIAMIMIVFHHYCVHGGINTENASFLNECLFIFFSSYGKLGVVIFVMLTGYFSCTSRFNSKRLVLLLAETVFYSVVWYIIVCLIGEETFDIINFIKSFSVLFYSKYWFFTCYIALSLFVPILNVVINDLSRKEHLLVCIVGGIAYSFISSFSNYLYWNELVYFLYLYVVAAYLRLYDRGRSIKFDVSGLLISFLVGWTINYINRFIPNVIIEQNLIFQPFLLQSTTNLFIAIFALLICKKVKPHSSKTINYVAGSTFGVYLLHDCIYRMVLWVKIFKNAMYFEKSFLVFALHMFSTVIIVLIVATVIDIVRRELLERYFARLYDYCAKCVNKSKLTIKIKNVLDKFEE